MSDVWGCGKACFILRCCECVGAWTSTLRIALVEDNLTYPTLTLKYLGEAFIQPCWSRLFHAVALPDG